MIERFEKLTGGITQIYKNIQKIKRHEMGSLGLKGTHVMCLYFLSLNPDGLTASDLCRKCQEDKASISRILADLEKHAFITYDLAPNGKKYRAKAKLTAAGKDYSEKVTSLILRATEEGGKGITAEEREIFYRVLSLIADNLNTFCLQFNTPQKGNENIYE